MARGSVRRRSSSSWELRWDGPRTEDGKRNPQRKTFRGSKKAAEAELNRLMADLGKADVEKRSEMTVKDLSRLFLEERVIDLRPGSLAEYERFFRRYLLPECGGMSLVDLDRNVCQKVVNRMVSAGLAPSTVQSRYAYLSGLFSWAVRCRYLNESPVAGVTLPPLPDESVGKALTAEQALAVLELYEGTPYWLPVFLALHTGLRPGEVLGLCWPDVDLDGGSLFVRHTLHKVSGRPVLGPPKNRSSRRVVALSPSVVGVLRELREVRPSRFWCGFQEYVGSEVRFCTEVVDIPQVCSRADGVLLTVHSWEGAFRRCIRRGELEPLRPHDLRHTHATLLLLEGVPIHVVSKRLGHSNIDITVSTYGHLLPNSDPEAAARFEHVLARNR